MFVPLHVKSEFSPGHSAAAVEELLHRAGPFGIPAMALTNVENLYGQVRFHRAARSYGIKPITGVELRAQYQAGTLGCKSGRLVLLARDRLGYESLCRIITGRRSAVRGYDPLDCLKAEPRGVFFLSDDASVIEALLQGGVSRCSLPIMCSGLRASVRPSSGFPP